MMWRLLLALLATSIVETLGYGAKLLSCRTRVQILSVSAKSLDDIGSEARSGLSNSSTSSYSSDALRLKGNLRSKGVLLPPNTDLSLSAKEVEVLAKKEASQESGEGPSDLDVLRESLRQMLENF